MIQHPLKSSMLSTVGYNQETETLVAQFNHGKFYRYDGVSAEAFVGVLTNQESHGRSFNELIKQHFTGVEINAEQAALL